MGDGLDLSRGRRSRRRTRRRLAVLGAVLVLAAGVWGLRGRLGPVWAVLSGLPGWVDARLAEHFVPGYTDRLRALRRRNALLHGELAAAAPLQAENEALRTLLESPTRSEGGGWQPVRVMARDLNGSVTLAGQFAPGTPVLDDQGRLAGVVCEADDTGSRVDPVGTGRGAAAVLAGACCGVVQREGGNLVLTGLPRNCELPAGGVVSTADGLWVGTLAQAPTPDDTGLTEWAPLQDTGDTGGAVLFLPAGDDGD